MRLAVPMLLLAALAAGAAGPAAAQTPSIKVWSARGDAAVYEPGDAISIGVRASFDANVLVYEIDAEGMVHLLYPSRDESPQIQADAALRLPADGDEQLVVDGPVGEGYIVAIASVDPFRRLPSYLRPADAQAEALGYTEDEADIQGVSSDGKIVGDPFVAMERIRRAVVADPTDRGGFATAYQTYYVHQQVRYPRYLCYDCHRPGYWAWWDGFDPYYSTCSVFEFRVNSGWWWGPTYWNGFVPYYAFVYRSNCPPRYRPHGAGSPWYSSWDGWRRWGDLWGGPLRRYKSPPPVSYVSPDRWRRNARGASPSDPPGFLAIAHTGRFAPPGLGSGPGIRRERVGDGGSPRPWLRPGGGRDVRRDGRPPGVDPSRPVWNGSGRQRPWRPSDDWRGNDSRPERGLGSGAQRPEYRAPDRPAPDPGGWHERRAEPSPPPQRSPEQGSQRHERGRDNPPPANTSPPSQDRHQRDNDNPRGWGDRSKGR